MGPCTTSQARLLLGLSYIVLAGADEIRDMPHSRERFATIPEGYFGNEIRFALYVVPALIVHNSLRAILMINILQDTFHLPWQIAVHPEFFG